MKDTSKYLQDSYACEFCGKVFKTGRQLGGHVAHCLKHPDKQAHDLAAKKGGELLKAHLQDRAVVHPFKGKHLSKEHKEKLSVARAKNLVNEYLPREWVHIREWLDWLRQHSYKVPNVSSNLTSRTKKDAYSNVHFAC